MRFTPLTPDQTALVEQLEQAATPHPWRQGQLDQSLIAGHSGLILHDQDQIKGYLVWQVVLDEAELLNIVVRKEDQGRGYGQLLLEEWFRICDQSKLQLLHLEVRANNVHAQRLYQQKGFRIVGKRKNYYPAGENREDAILMTRQLDDQQP